MLVDFSNVQNIFIVCGRTDMRCGIDGLAGIISDKYNIELALQRLSPEERYEQRQLQVKPVIEAFYDFLGSFIQMKGKLQTTVHYVLNQKQELMTFLNDVRLEASNNRVERAIKTVVIGRKNYLFSTSLAGSEANAIIYSVIP